ncbi:uncharacterized protein LOC121796477 [Salvia splendens]|uniref:uncharacterized protein LOC121796477 n=1 Tax=Salvia splendens TaxID=180675 RepID=UPI001C27F45E|nr:uncharacterized protein LOC121796477 [Salvia splendens]
MEPAAGDIAEDIAGNRDRNRESHVIPVTTKNLIAQSLLQSSHLGNVPYGAFQKAVKEFGVSRKTVYKIWSEAKKQIHSGVPVNIANRVKGFKRKDQIQLDTSKVRSLSILERCTIRKMVVKLELSKTTVGRMVKDVVFNGMLKYHTMHNVVHIDEKWFFMTKATDRYYLLPDEEEPYRAIKSKRFITKVMFMCAVCRPYIAENGEVIFDGKIDIFHSLLKSQQREVPRTNQEAP